MNIFFGAFLALAVATITYRLYEYNFIVLQPTENWTCERVLEGVAHGPEDLVLSARLGVLFVSSHNRRAMSSTGTVLAVDSRTGLAMQLHLPNPPKNFRPHGMSLFEDDDRTVLFVISHRWELQMQHAVEVFEFDGSSATLTHVRTLSSQLMSSPNDLFALGFDELVVSNDHCDGNMLLQLLHDAAGHGCADTVHYRGGVWVSLADSLAFGNGIIASGKEPNQVLLRAACSSSKLYNYTIDRAGPDGTMQLQLNYAESLPFLPDNIEYDAISGGFLIAGHPSGLRFILNALFDVPAPSAVLLYRGFEDHRVLYYSDGAELSASSVAVRTNESTYFLGQVFDSFILRCTAI